MRAHFRNRSGLFVNLSLLYLNSPPQLTLVATKSRVSCGFLAMASDCWKMNTVKYIPSLLNTWKTETMFVISFCKIEIVLRLLVRL